jgi:c-di-GMP-binding flagellar brake protein YcgR
MLQQQAVPSPKTVCLSSLGLQFPCDDAKDLRENDNLYLEMFLESRYPQAFITLAKVIQIKPQAEGDEVLVRFADLSEQNQQWLDKYVFQLHRRQVALSRKTDRPLVFK